jgi:pimeloyl-ACP methyl ester carboxylesterase
LSNVGEDIETLVRRSSTAITGKGFTVGHPEDLDQIVKNAKAKPMTPESYQRQLGAGMAHDASNRLDKISAPTLVIHGEYDPLIPFENGKYLAAHIKGARLSSYPGVGHLPIVEEDERFNREVIEFLG